MGGEAAPDGTAATSSGDDKGEQKTDPPAIPPDIAKKIQHDLAARQEAAKGLATAPAKAIAPTPVGDEAGVTRAAIQRPTALYYSRTSRSSGPKHRG